MLIITIPIQLHSINLEMPLGAPPLNQEKPQIIKIDIDQNNQVYWQGTSINADTMNKNMVEIAAQTMQPDVHLRPNKNCDYAVFANILATTKRLGLTKIAVIGSEQFVQ